MNAPTIEYKNFTPAKEVPVCEAPTGLTATYGQTLADVKLSNPADNTPGTWTWADPSQQVGDVGTNAFKATFTPEDTNTYQTVTNVDVQVQVSPKATTFDVTVDPAAGEYTGSAHSPKVTVKDGDTVLTERKDYTLSWTDDMTSVGEKTVTVTGTGNYEGSSGTASYRITKKNQDAVVITGADGKTYGDADFEITVSGGSGTGAYSLTAGTDDVLTLTPTKDADTWTAHILKAGSVTLTASREGDDNYEAATKTEVQLTVKPKSVDGLTVTLPDDFSATYTGSAIAPQVTVMDGIDELSNDTDYTVSYKDNTNAGTATVTITGKGNYDSATSKDITFKIEPKPLAEDDFTIDLADKDYSGEQIKPSVSSTALVSDKDYDVAYGENTNAGSGTITITGKGNYTGKIEKTFTINKADYTGEKDAELSVLSSKYDLNLSTDYSLDLASLIAAGGAAGTASGTGEMVTSISVTGTTLKVTVKPAVAGTTQEITVPVTGCTNYKDYNITVTVKSVDKQPATVTLDNDTVTYDGQAHALTPVWPTGDGSAATKTVTYAPAAGGESSDQAPKNAGTYTVTAVFEDETYYGKATATLTIDQLEAVLTWSGNTGLVYDGSEKDVTAAVSNLVPGDTCTVTVNGGKAVDAGEYTATAHSLSNPNYKLPAETTCEYTIDPKVVNNLTVVLDQNSFEYNEGVQKPAVTAVKDGEAVLSAEDYTVSIPESEDVGTYKVTVTVTKGNYEGSTGEAEYRITKQLQAALVISDTTGKTYGDAAFEITVSGGSGTGAVTLTSSDPSILKLEQADGKWTATILKAGTVTLKANKAGDDNYEPAAEVSQEVVIAAKELDASWISLPESYAPIYDTTAKTPEITVKNGEITLVKGTDYTVDYSNNTAAGEATVTVTGTGNYTGVKTVNFTIAKASLAEKVPTIVGTAQVGSVLTAKLDGVAGSEYTWTWYRDGAAIDDADAASYVVTTADSNKDITVKATAKAEGNYDGTTQSSEAVTVAKQTITGTVTIAADNSPIAKDTVLTANASVVPAGAALSYQWNVDGTAVENATADTYTVLEADEGKSITVTVTATGDCDGSITSEPVEVGKTVVKDIPAISFDLEVDAEEKTITAKIEVGEVQVDFVIRWLRNGVDTGVVGETYEVTDADKGSEIVAVATVKDSDTYTGALVSDPEAIAATAPAAPTVTASAGNGQVTVSWTVSDNGGKPVTSYTVQCGEDGPITLDAATTSYTFTGLENGTEYTFKVTAANAVGTSAEGSVSATPSTPSGGGGGGGVTTYAVAVEKSENGTVTASTKNAGQGATVTLTIAPDEGYVLDTITATDKDGKSVALTKVSDTKYTFKMPASAVTVKAAFAEKPDESKLPFTDVAESAWYYDAVAYVYGNGMMTGTNDGTTFSPAMSLTRGMMAQVMFNIEKGTAPAAGTFTDVAAGAWYADAVNWAAANGIVDGYGNNKFGPEDSITREQMAVLLYNYAEFKGYDMTASADLTTFSDGEQVSGWAEYAMKWAVAEGLINGSNNALNPLGTASRAEVAQILANFGQNVAK